MKHSSKAHPCPACGRTHDGDCRWSDDVILCHSGTDLTKGQTVTIAGQQWYLSRTNGGYDGGAAVFRPHKEEHKPVGASREQLLNHRAKRAVAAVAIERFHNAFDRAWAVLDFHSLAPSELKQGIEAIKTAELIGNELKPSLQTIWREHPDLKDLHRERVEAQLKSLKYQVADLRHFRTHYLGEAI